MRSERHATALTRRKKSLSKTSTGSVVRRCARSRMLNSSGAWSLTLRVPFRKRPAQRRSAQDLEQGMPQRAACAVQHRHGAIHPTQSPVPGRFPLSPAYDPARMSLPGALPSCATPLFEARRRTCESTTERRLPSNILTTPTLPAAGASDSPEIASATTRRASPTRLDVHWLTAAVC